MDVYEECNKLLKTSSCLVRMMMEPDKSVAKVRIMEARQNLDNLEQYIKEQEKEQNNG